MMNRRWLLLVTAGLGPFILAAGAADWPQWRGRERDGRAVGFVAPPTWPKELKKVWKVEVGDGVATPALVGDKLYVFSRQGGNEITRCLDAATGKEVWQDKYAAAGANGPAGRFPGPRSSPAVAEGKVVTLGVRGTLSCLDATSGSSKLWRNTEFAGSVPRFFTSSSPLLVDGLCIVQLGGERNGAIVAYDLNTGKQKWKWTGEGTAYASPVLQTLDGTKTVVAETNEAIVGLGLNDGKLLWQTPFAVEGRGYNACTPIVEGATVIVSGSNRGTQAVRIEKDGDKFKVQKLWTNEDNSVQFNSPVLKDNLVYGISSRDELFCIDAQNGKTAWTTSIRGNRGYGSVVDAGSVLMAMTPSARLIVFEPGAKAFKELARYEVAEGGAYAYPVVTEHGVFIKDTDSVTLWSLK
ncbi:MAG: PQQ-like beta-propeller repeat protein [Planctomycetes bacterium]|nr:PQQ-like beta-propeller repeat protein [Planctomycetota bacterium]